MENTFDILDRFVNGQALTDEEFAALKRLFATREGGRTIEMWLAAKWETASDADAEIETVGGSNFEDSEEWE